jgi:hypothetical protein
MFGWFRRARRLRFAQESARVFLRHRVALLRLDDRLDGDLAVQPHVEPS